MSSVLPASTVVAPGSNPEHLLTRELGVRQLAAIIFNYTPERHLPAAGRGHARSPQPVVAIAVVVATALYALRHVRRPSVLH